MRPWISAALMGLASLIGIVASSSAQAQRTTGGVLSRERAILLAVGDDPGLAAAGATLDAAEAGLRQADRRPNPVAGLTSQDVGGSGPYQGLSRAETTATFALPLELGGDRGARRALAAREVDLASLGGEVRRLDLIEAVELAFVDAQAAQAALEVAETRLAAERELASAIRRRVGQARDPEMVAVLADARVAESEVGVENAERVAAAARAALASYWGGAADFDVEMASFESLDEGETAAVGQSPDVALADLDRRRAEARIDVERARAMPDLTVEGGLRQYSQTDDVAFVVGLSIPIPLWNNNAGAIARARAEARSAGLEIEARARAIARERDMALAQRDAAQMQAEALETRVIPQAGDALARARQGYAAGAFSHLDVVEAQRALADARLRRVSALQTYHRAQATLARLAGARADAASLEEMTP